MLAPQSPPDAALANRTPPPVRLLLFVTSHEGHYLAYIQHLCRYWGRQSGADRLSVVVSAEFSQRHQQAIAELLALTANLEFIAIPAATMARLAPRKSPWHRAMRALQEWRLVCQYARTLKAHRILLLYLDSFQTPLALGLKAPCPLLGIYFRPTLHYSTFGQFTPSRKDRIQQVRERFVLPRVLHHPQLQTVFCIDPYAAAYLNRRFSSSKVIRLADPVDPDPIATAQITPSQVARLRQQLGILPQRQVWLLFGLLDGRKGIDQVLQAIAQLPPALADRLCLLLVGEVPAANRPQLLAQIEQLRQQQPIQILCQPEFIPEAQVPLYFQLADGVLATYQRHVGMSGILLLAAAAGKPVLSSDYGLMGELVRQYGLGLAVDTTQPEAIADGLTQFLQQSAIGVGDKAGMARFAQENGIDQFVHTLFHHFYPQEVNHAA